MLRGLAWVMLIIATAASTAWWYWLQDDAPVAAATGDIADYTLHDFTLTRLDTNGVIIQRLQAQEARHYATAATQLVAPQLWLYRNQQLVWHIQAERGEVSPDQSEIWLLGKTRLLRETQQTAQQLEILTADVRVWQLQEYLETTAPTQIISAQGTTQSVGMQAWLATELIKLPAQVKSHYRLQH